jgi:regulator of RNase E activity RraB
MFEDLPNDADGDALRRLLEDGSDLTQEMEIDFAMDIPDQEAGLAFAEIVRPLGYAAEVQKDDESNRWTCYCIITIVPAYETMISIQESLADLGRPFGAIPDGWGSFGNAPD